MRKPTAWESHGLQIVEMRRLGCTLQEIGDHVSITRERVRQILEEHHVKAEAGLLTEMNMAEVLDCPIHRLRKLRKQGMLNPVRRGKRFFYYDRAELEKAKLTLQRACSRCGELLRIDHIRKYCSKCQGEHIRYKYR